MKKELLLAIYFLGVGVAAALGALLFLSPRRFARILEILNPASRRFGLKSSTDGDLYEVKPSRLAGLGIFLMAMIMFIGPLLDMMNQQGGTPASLPLPEVRQSRFDVIELAGYIFLFLYGLFFFVRPKLLISISKRVMPRRDFSDQEVQPFLPRVRLFAALFMLLILYLIARMFWH